MKNTLYNKWAVWCGKRVSSKTRILTYLGNILLKVHLKYSANLPCSLGKHMGYLVPLATFLEVACIFYIWKAFRRGHSLFLSEKYVFNNTYSNCNQAHMCIFSVEVRLQAHVVFAEYLTVCVLCGVPFWVKVLFSFVWQAQ